MTHKRITILIGLFLAIISVYGRTGYSETLTLKQRMHLGEQIKQLRVPTHATREEVLVLIKEEEPDMLYLDAHHVACTEWDIDRICKAAAEVKMPVLMRIDHADQAGMISSLLDLGHDISIQKHPGFETIEDCRKFVENALKGTHTVF